MKRLLLPAVLAITLAIPGLAVAQDLPAVLAGLNLTDIEVHQKSRSEYGSAIRGTLPGGARIEIELDRNGAVEEVEVRGRTLFPVAEIVSLIPAPVLENASWPAEAQLEKLEFEHNGRIEIEGRLADGREFEAEFAADGRLLDFDADD